MFGVFLTSISSFLEEVFSSIGKYKTSRGEESLHTMAFLSLLGGTLFFWILIFFEREAFRFSFASLPTFIPRVALSVIQEYITISAIVKAERSTFSFIRIGTIPLLLAVDAFLGYTLTMSKIIGITIIVVTLLLLFEDEVFNKKGIGFTFFSTVNAVVTVSLYKYNITYFNSVAAEQGILSLILMFCFFLSAVYIAKENPFLFLAKSTFLFQAGAQGAAGVIESFAYVFAPASIIIAAKRSFAMIWSIVSGNFYFHELHIAIKITAVLFLVGGIVLLTI
ncbi:MAG: hypothetical protein HY001_04475 [Candidatus Portnoybacteria bacterium]|nr:hypothetical protein [Candidatus Portnoybacteria bacterium]